MSTKSNNKSHNAQWLLRLALFLLVWCTASHAFTTTTHRHSIATNRHRRHSTTPRTTTTTQLHEGRRWNFNDGTGPFGLKRNAEIWNGRFAQVAFVLVFLQELIQGKGIVQGLSEGDVINYVSLGVTVVSVLGMTVFLALQGPDDYVKKELEGDSSSNE